MNQLTAQGKYTAPDKSTVEYEYDFIQYDIDDLSTHANAILELANRQAKVDGNNRTREKVKAENGHSVRAVMSEEAKAKLKEQSAKNRALLKALKSNPDILAQLGF